MGGGKYNLSKLTPFLPKVAIGFAIALTSDCLDMLIVFVSPQSFRSRASVLALFPISI